MTTFRVYRYYVGCHVYNVTAETPEAARESLEMSGDMAESNVFLHEANEPSENHLFTEVYRYVHDDAAREEHEHSLTVDADETEDDPAFVFNPACANFWRTLPVED